MKDAAHDLAVKDAVKVLEDPGSSDDDLLQAANDILALPRATVGEEIFLLAARTKGYFDEVKPWLSAQAVKFIKSRLVSI